MVYVQMSASKLCPVTLSSSCVDIMLYYHIDLIYIIMLYMHTCPPFEAPARV